MYSKKEIEEGLQKLGYKLKHSITDDMDIQQLKYILLQDLGYVKACNLIGLIDAEIKNTEIKNKKK